MSEFARLDASDVVINVILADQAFINSGHVGDPATWLPVIPAGSAGIGYSYDRAYQEFVPPGGALGPSAEEAKAQLMAMIEAATAPILDAYPSAEQLSWDAKETEALAFMAAEEPVLSDYALLRSECAAEMAIAAGDVTVEQLAGKVEAVLWMASQWRVLVSFLSGLRKRTYAAIDAAEDGAGRTAAVDGARLAIIEALSGG